MLDNSVDPIKPVEVIDAIEQHLASGRFWVYVGKGASMGPLVRRLTPGFIWRQNHKVEGF